MLEVTEKPSVCSTRPTFCDWHELLLEKTVRVVEDAANSIRDMEVMLKSFIEGVMSKVEAKLGENEDNLRALEHWLIEDELENNSKSLKVLTRPPYERSARTAGP